MTRPQIESFLHERGTGVLSLTRDGMAYAIPISFAYDDAYHRCLFDLGFVPESRKHAFIESTELACFTTYEWDSPSAWKSVVLTGVLRRLEDIDLTNERSFYAEATEIEITVFDHPPEDIDHQWYEFVINDQSGRSSQVRIDSDAPEDDDSGGRDDGQ
ncbi:pyridoxamine 5'-phosphate oxidase family protein [Halovivax gelatinilyticus]|uniref:pyridoxamine 5'-phosphate oxidase family protein n=1 Tax=Halovivax gelatinilyticus TaxID=2961597 RepID=UPI0020CA4E04|nr:pyridoxamine 5'-phosphate oxidase family protein [Halovivax gelatinilyticus]